MTGITLFIAFAESDARSIETAQVIYDGVFASGIPLKTTPAAALSSALAVNTLQAMKAAVETTRWYVLELKWDAARVGTSFLNHSLVHAKDRNGPGVFTFRAPLLLTDGDYWWREIEVGPTGLDAWSRFMKGYFRV
eukprot:4760244-Heterocapsa_arctica.AAC.1